MAEALVAFGLAANLFQFVDIGTRFTSNVWKIYRSGHQGLAEVLDIQKTTEDLRKVLHGFGTPNERNARLSNDECGFQELLKGCRLLANELLESLQKMHPLEKSRKRDALKGALKMIWKEEDLKSMQSRLDGYRQEIVVHLLSLIRYV